MNMKKLAKGYIEALERATRLREEMVQLLRDTEKQHRGDETGRRLALESIQHDVYVVVLAQRLTELQKYSGVPMRELAGEAKLILDKRRNADMLERPPVDMRTPDEERLYGALRGRWFELTKLAEIRPMRAGPRR
jgi:hypothetical protein